MKINEISCVAYSLFIFTSEKYSKIIEKILNLLIY